MHSNHASYKIAIIKYFPIDDVHQSLTYTQTKSNPIDFPSPLNIPPPSKGYPNGSHKTHRANGCPNRPLDSSKRLVLPRTRRLRFQIRYHHFPNNEYVERDCGDDVVR